MASSSYHVERTSTLPVSADEAFAWHERPGALERLTPPWERVRVVERTGGIEDGARVTFLVRVGPASFRWVAVHRDYERGRRFVDEQAKGPFSHWIHQHLFEPLGPGSSRYTDRIEFGPPFGTLGIMAGSWLARPRLERALAYRHALLREDLAAHARVSGRGPLHVAITGASGFIGRQLAPFLTTGGHRVTPVTRRSGVPGTIHWHPSTGTIDAEAFEGVDAVIHLAGENIGTRWNDEKKRSMRQSRVDGTRLLAQTLARLRHPPRVLISASAMGIYGNRGNKLLSEEDVPAGPPPDFFVHLGREWEAAADPARDAGIRVVHPRFGLVLSPEGGALGRMLLPFKAGVGGQLGNGTQWVSWISMDDAVGVVHHAIFTDELSGPVNAAAPEAVTSKTFASTLGKVLHRPALLPAPAPALKLVFGEMADTALLASQRLSPAKLLDSGYSFRHPKLETALRHELGRT